MLTDPTERRRLARENVAKSLPKDPDADPRDVLSPFDRDIVGAKSVLLRLPLRDPVEVRRHLALIEETCRALRMRIDQRGSDRTHLFTVRGALRQLNQKMNAFRTPRPD